MMTDHIAFTLESALRLNDAAPRSQIEYCTISNRAPPNLNPLPFFSPKMASSK